MRIMFMALCLLLTSPLLSAEPDKFDVERVVAAERDKQVAKLEKQIKRLKEEAKAFPRNRDRKSVLAEIRGELRDAEGELADLKTGRKIPIPAINWFQPAVKDFGDLDNDKRRFLILDVINDREFVGELRYVQSTLVIRNGVPVTEFNSKRLATPFLIRGVDTTKMVEDGYTELEGVFAFVDKVKWNGRSVFVAQPFFPERVEGVRWMDGGKVKK